MARLGYHAVVLIRGEFGELTTLVAARILGA